MPITNEGYVIVQPGLKWNRRTKKASFDVWSPGRVKRHRSVRGFESVEAAKSAFAKYRDAIRRNKVKYDLGDMPIFGRYVADHWESMSSGVNPQTFRKDSGSLRTHLLPYFADTPLDEIDELAVDEYIASLKKRVDASGNPAPVSAATINYSLRMLRKVLHNARKRKLIRDVPEIPFEKQTVPRNELSPEEQAAYLSTFDDEPSFHQYLARKRVLGPRRLSKRYTAEREFGASLKPGSEAAKVYFSRFQEAKSWFVTALHTGLRRSDLTNLKWSSVDLSAGFIRVATQKTDHEAVIAISRTLRNVLRGCRERRVVSDYVLVTSDGTRFSDAAINKYHSIAKSIAGINRRVRIHDLRHTFGSNLASAGLSTLVIASCLGHTSTKMTERYARPSAHALTAVADALDQIVRPPRETTNRAAS